MIPPFLEEPPTLPTPFYGKILNPPFLAKFRKLNPYPLPLYKGGIPTMFYPRFLLRNILRQKIAGSF